MDVREKGALVVAVSLAAVRSRQGTGCRRDSSFVPWPSQR